MILLTLESTSEMYLSGPFYVNPGHISTLLPMRRGTGVLLTNGITYSVTESPHMILSRISDAGEKRDGCRNCGTAVPPDPDERSVLCDDCDRAENNAAYHEGQWRDG